MNTRNVRIAAVALFALIAALLSTTFTAQAGGGMPPVNATVVETVRLGFMQDNHPVVTSTLTSAPEQHFNRNIIYFGGTVVNYQPQFADGVGSILRYSGLPQSQLQPAKLTLKPIANGQMMFYVHWEVLGCSTGPTIILARFKGGTSRITVIAPTNVRMTAMIRSQSAVQSNSTWSTLTGSNSTWSTILSPVGQPLSIVVNGATGKLCAEATINPAALPIN